MRRDETMSHHDPRTSTRTDGLYFPHWPADNERYSLRFYSAKMDHMFRDGGIPLWMHRAECRAEGCRGHYSN
jgi:hypothetical protein